MQGRVMSTTTISSFTTFRVLCLAAAGLLFVPAGISKGAISLWVNGEDREFVEFELGQPCVIEIVSNNNSEYGFVVGFPEFNPPAVLEHVETKPEAGTDAWIELGEYGRPLCCGYYGEAFGGPSAGVHFVFQYTAYEPDRPVRLELWDWDFNLVDVVDIMALPPLGACCDQVTGNCYMSSYHSWDCPHPYTWLGAGTDCSMCEPLPLTVASPNGGECLLANTTYTITWSGGWSIDEILIEYSTDNEQNWNAVTTVANSGSYNWLVPVVDSNQCLVRISDVLNPSVSDTSDLVFSIELTRYSGGTGEPNNPYRIATAQDLNDIGNYEEDWGKQFILVKDVNLAEYTGTRFRIIGNSSIGFTGVFDGNDHKIWNFTWISGGVDCVGLFAYLGRDGQIKNLGMENLNVNATNGDCVGGLVGYNWRGTIANCYLTGNISGCGVVGGLVGDNDGTINSCSSTGSVSGEFYVGGLVGLNYGTITCCYSTGRVSGTKDRIGGLVGSNYPGTVNNCYSTGSVLGATDVGGLVGYGGGVVNSFWDIETSGRLESEGGGIGKTTEEMKTASTFFSWGVCSYEGIWTIDDGNDYPRLVWEGKPGELLVHRLTDFIEGAGTEGYPYLVSTAEQLNSIGLFPCELDKYYRLVNDVNLAAYTSSEFNIIGPFTGVFDGNDHRVLNFTWSSAEGGEYIGLFGYVGKGGQIKNLGIENADVNAVGGACVGGLVGANDGTITRCYSSGSVSGSQVIGGIVGYNKAGTIIESHSSASVSGYSGAGGLVGRNGYYQQYSEWFYGECINIYASLIDQFPGWISNCYSTGAVSGTTFVGGLVGENLWDSRIINCYSLSSVSGTDYVGGLVGRNGHFETLCDEICFNPECGGGCWTECQDESFYAQIRNCYSTGRVSGVSEVGGLVGSDISGENDNSFWDIETSDCNTSAAGIRKSTAEMRRRSTFTDAGWDFFDEAANGTADDWRICVDEVDYPRLTSEYVQGGDFVCPDGVNALDFSALARYWHETDCAALNDCDGADIDLSGAVDFGDVAVVAESWLTAL